MKNFNLKLYFQALKKLRLLTLASLAVSLLIIILYYSTLDFTPRAYGFSMYSYSIYRLMLVFAYVGGFFFTAIAFSFLLRRSRSDFYHSIPISRSCVLITNLSAVLTSTMAVIIVSFVADTVAAMWVYQINSFDFLPYKLCEIFGIIAVMLAVCGCTLMGLSFAGDIVTSTLFSVLAACAPRLIFDSCVNTVFQGGLNLSMENLPGIFAPYLDLVSQPIIGVLKQNMQIRAPDQMENVIFTLVLAIIYLIIGSLLFLRRKSEHAESPALSLKSGLFSKAFCLFRFLKVGWTWWLQPEIFQIPQTI